MKLILLTAALFLLSAGCLQAQTRKTYKVAPGERVPDALLKARALYQYPQFSEAEVAFKNGRYGGGRMNYNRLLGDMQYIEANGDTLTLADSKEVASVIINADTFFFQEGYLQLVDDFKIKVAKKTILELTNRQRLGGMGELSSASIASYSGVSSNQGKKDVVPNEVLTFSETTTYFISDRFNRFKPLNKKNLFAFYAKRQKEVETYLQANPVNFLKEEDVLHLIGFLKTL